jgi:hypothetical protein
MVEREPQLEEGRFSGERAFLLIETAEDDTLKR